jgi:hypothetical protein
MRVSEAFFLMSPAERFSVLTEQEVSRSWARLFKGEKTSETFVKAEALLDELRPESPLRHRLGVELEELRELATHG